MVNELLRFPAQPSHVWISFTTSSVIYLLYGTRYLLPYEVPNSVSIHLLTGLNDFLERKQPNFERFRAYSKIIILKFTN